VPSLRPNFGSIRDGDFKNHKHTRLVLKCQIDFADYFKKVTLLIHSNILRNIIQSESVYTDLKYILYIGSVCPCFFKPTGSIIQRIVFYKP
jgi:hypothetical protein